METGFMLLNYATIISQNSILAYLKISRMKHSFFTFLVLISALCASAADIKVDRTGAIVGSVTSISAAITAAADGDRIVVFSNGLIYNENLTINKSLTILCAAEGEYFFLTGSITIVPVNGREITIVGMHQNGSIASGGVNPVGARCVVNIVDCEIAGTVTFNQDGYDVNLLYNYIWQNTQIRYGKVIANKFGNETTDGGFIYGFLSITAESATYGVGDTLFVIANRMLKTDNLGTGSIFTFDNPNLRYFIANNSIRTGVSSGTQYTTNQTAVNVLNCYLPDSANVFINNYCSAIETGGTCVAGTTYGCVQLKGIKTENFANNLLKNRYGSSYGCGALQMRGDYNYYDAYRAYPSGTDNNMFSVTGNVPITYDNITGKVTAGVGGINSAKPGAAYTDIDLTRGDIGPWGGPWTQENYWDTNNPQGGRARVFLLNMPSNVYSLTTPVSIKANATHTK